jgi:hypothetical protein
MVNGEVAQGMGPGGTANKPGEQEAKKEKSPMGTG